MRQGEQPALEVYTMVNDGQHGRVWAKEHEPDHIGFCTNPSQDQGVASEPDEE